MLVIPANQPFETPGIDINAPRVDRKGIELVNPHRGDMVQLDSVVWWNEDITKSVGTRIVRDDEFWTTGHIPGRPLYPGVLMIECAAQLSSYTQLLSRKDVEFLGFTRCDDTAFRGQVVPGDEMVVFADVLSANRRRFVSRVHGFVGEKLIFETKITGMVM